jgi:hypothetical protein
MITKISDTHLLDDITKYYLESDDFNGISLGFVRKKHGEKWPDLLEILRDLVNRDLVGVIFSDVELNPHIIRTGFEEKEIQIAKLAKVKDFSHTCLYPRPTHLEVVVNPEKYAGKPYNLALAMGAPQLSFRSFDLTVLEYYRNDPRYFYANDDIRGMISIKDEFYETEKMDVRDQILLKTFGFSYDNEFNRAVAAFVGYLARLTSEHQHLWKAKELAGSYKLHPDYYRNTILGNWGTGSSVFDAFLAEIYLINRMTSAMGKPALFRLDYGESRESKPRKFSFLVRPTLEEFNQFVLMLDQMISDNIDKEFFQDEVPYEIETPRRDGKIIVQNKGTLQILDDWMKTFYETDDWTPWDDVMKAFREIRKLRQKPAHSVNENEFDQKYFHLQRDLIIRAYEAMRVLRMIFQSHPLVVEADIKIPKWLDEGKIWTQ